MNHPQNVVYSQTWTDGDKKFTITVCVKREVKAGHTETEYIYEKKQNSVNNHGAPPFTVNYAMFTTCENIGINQLIDLVKNMEQVPTLNSH